MIILKCYRGYIVTDDSECRFEPKCSMNIHQCIENRHLPNGNFEECW